MPGLRTMKEIEAGRACCINELTQQGEMIFVISVVNGQEVLQVEVVDNKGGGNSLHSLHTFDASQLQVLREYLSKE